MILTNTLNYLLAIIVPHFNFFVNKKLPEGSFLRFTWTITLRNVISGIRLRPGGAPIDEHYAWQVRSSVRLGLCYLLLLPPRIYAPPHKLG